MQFDVRRADTREHAVLRVTGELDVATTPELDRAGGEALDGARSLVVDLTGTTFMDSSGARALTVLARRAARAGVPAQVVCPQGNSAVRLVLDLLDLASVLPVVETLPAAQARTEGDDLP